VEGPRAEAFRRINFYEEFWRKKQERRMQFEERQSGVWDLDFVDGEILAHLTHLCRSSGLKLRRSFNGPRWENGDEDSS
jgi:hypothetical protein